MQASEVQESTPKRTFTEDARRTQIVRAAIATFAELGYARTSFAKIAKTAKLSSTGMISYHFASKDDLVRACAEELSRRAVEFMQPRIAAVSGYAEKLRAYIESNVALAHQHPTEMLALIEILHNANDAEGNSIIDDRVATDRVHVFADHLRQGQLAGEFGKFNAKVVALSLVGAIDSLVSDGKKLGLDLARSGHELADAFEKVTSVER